MIKQNAIRNGGEGIWKHDEGKGDNVGRLLVKILILRIDTDILSHVFKLFQKATFRSIVTAPRRTPATSSRAARVTTVLPCSATSGSTALTKTTKMTKCVRDILPEPGN